MASRLPVIVSFRFIVSGWAGIGVSEAVRAGSMTVDSFDSVEGRGAGVTAGELVDVGTPDDSSVVGARLVAPAECRAERRLRRLEGAWTTRSRSSPPLVPSTSASLILSLRVVNNLRRAAERSPPETVLLRPSLPSTGWGDADGERKVPSWGSMFPVSFCHACIRAATLFDRMRPLCIASKVGIMGAGDEVPEYSGVPGDRKFWDISNLEAEVTAR